MLYGGLNAVLMVQQGLTWADGLTSCCWCTRGRPPTVQASVNRFQSEELPSFA